MQRHFTPQWEEAVPLNDGTKVLLRLGRKSDRMLLRRGFRELSTASKLMRFLAEKPTLSEAEVDLLTDLDDENHVAIAAVILDAVGREEGVAVARFIRSPTTPYEAEPAIAVTDATQGQGLGLVLGQRLAQAAVERGVTTFRFDVLAANTRMTSLVSDVARFTHVGITPVDDVLEVRVDLRPLVKDGAAYAGFTDARFVDAARTIFRHASHGVSSLALKRAPSDTPDA